MKNLEDLSPDGEKIIELLTENNRLLNNLYQLELNKFKAEKHRQWIHLAIQVIPFIILAIITWFIYDSILHYLAALQNNVDLLKDSVSKFFDSFKNLIPDLSGVQDKLNTLWQSTKSAL